MKKEQICRKKNKPDAVRIPSYRYDTSIKIGGHKNYEHI